MTENKMEPKLPRQYRNWVNNAQGHNFEKANLCPEGYRIY